MESEFETRVEEWLSAIDAGGLGALRRLCSEHPQHAEKLRQRAAPLLASGLLGPETAEHPPRRLGDFRLLSQIGSGGMGVVYLAEQESLHRRVALKLIRPENLYFPDARARFRREVEAVARLQHPGIAQVFVVGEDSQLPYYAMELIEGCTLADVLAALRGSEPQALTGRDLVRAVGEACAVRGLEASSANGPVSTATPETWVEACLALVREVAEALEHSHRRGVIHRDVKPSNVLLALDGRVLLVDFGLAALSEAGETTRTGAQPGTMPYMSPEQVRGDRRAVGPATDVYALGVLLYEMLTLERPFGATGVEDLRRQILEGRARAPRRINRCVPRQAEAVCAAAMARDLARRYASAAELALDIGRVLARQPIVARPPGALDRVAGWVRRHPTVTLSGVTASAAAALVLGLEMRLARAQEGHRREVERGFPAKVQDYRKTSAWLTADGGGTDELELAQLGFDLLGRIGLDPRTGSTASELAAAFADLAARDAEAAEAARQGLYEVSGHLGRAGVPLAYALLSDREPAAPPTMSAPSWAKHLAAGRSLPQKQPELFRLWPKIIELVETIEDDPWRLAVFQAAVAWWGRHEDLTAGLESGSPAASGDDLAWLGSIVSVARGHQASLPILERAVAQSPGSFWARLWLGNAWVEETARQGTALARREAIDQALLQYTVAHALEPHSALALSDLGLAHINRAVLLYQLAKETSGEAGDALMREHDEAKAEAVRWYREAIEADPRTTITRNNLANVLIKEHPEEAEALWQQALSIDPCCQAALTSYTAVLYGAERFDEELRLREQEEACWPGSAKAHSFAADSHLGMAERLKRDRHLAEARDHFLAAAAANAKVIELAPNMPHYHIRFAKALLQGGGSAQEAQKALAAAVARAAGLTADEAADLLNAVLSIRELDVDPAALQGLEPLLADVEARLSHELGSL